MYNFQSILEKVANLSDSFRFLFENEVLLETGRSYSDIINNDINLSYSSDLDKLIFRLNNLCDDLDYIENKEDRDHYLLEVCANKLHHTKDTIYNLNKDKRKHLENDVAKKFNVSLATLLKQIQELFQNTNYSSVDPIVSDLSIMVDNISLAYLCSHCGTGFDIIVDKEIDCPICNRKITESYTLDEVKKMARFIEG